MRISSLAINSRFPLLIPIARIFTPSAFFPNHFIEYPQRAGPQFSRRQGIRPQGLSVARFPHRFMKQLRPYRMYDDRSLPGTKLREVLFG